MIRGCDRPLIRFLHSCQHPNKCGLSGPVRSDHADLLALLQRKRCMVKHLAFREYLCYLLYIF